MDCFMSTADSEKLKRICNDVWRDRADILSDCGVLSGETALLRAVYWRLCKVGDAPDQRINDAPLLKELVRQYRDETGQK
jgi:hypothetical protein